MDVTPPSTLRRLGIALAGLAVAGLTAVACVLSFDDLRALAIRGESRPDLAFLYPAGFDALLVVALIGVLLLRSAHLLVRAQAAVVLVLLIVAAAASNVSTALQVQLDVRPLAVGVAVAPWVMLAIGLWLWLLLIKHVQARRTSISDDDDSTAEQDIVPFHRSRPAETPPPLTKPVHPVLETTPVVGPTAAPETPPLSARVTHWPAAPEQEPDPAELPVRTTEPTPQAEWAQQPESDQEPAPRAGLEHDAEPGVRPPDAEDRKEPGAQPRGRTDPGGQTEPGAWTEPSGQTDPSGQNQSGGRTETGERTEPQPADAPTRAPKLRRGLRKRAQEPAIEEPRSEPEPEPTPEPEADPEPGPEPKRPVRWGDRIKPTDVLVHPRTPAVSDRDTDTQPVRVFSDTLEAPSRAAAAARPAAPESVDNPDPDHGPEAADPSESATARSRSLEDRASEDTAPHPVIEDDAPSGRLRSTPLPPEE